MRRIYLSGPMTGLPDENRPAFNAEAARLRALGYEVVNPAELNPPGTPRHICMRVDIQALLGCDTLALLPGWTESRGAILERACAFQMGFKVLASARITDPPLDKESEEQAA
ncbi:DUF4406 domain-containing protein [Metapseudomonas otitidis]|uniref:DUF4406 domain-containing protein n=1 Tax=Metapseudomonas otitidis TaxID=319939 RepID=UPI0040559986